jgi:hypothetical protein
VILAISLVFQNSNFKYSKRDFKRHTVLQDVNQIVDLRSIRNNPVVEGVRGEG